MNSGLTERLALLGEELAEAGAMVGKTLRHGLESTHPDGGPTNRRLLENELGDVLAAVELLAQEHDLDWHNIYDAKASKWERVGRYLHHNRPRLDRHAGGHP